MALGTVVVGGFIELTGLLWRHSLLLRERVYVHRQGHTALQLLRASLARAGTGLCVPTTSIPSVYGMSDSRNTLWVAGAIEGRTRAVVTHSTQTRTFVAGPGKRLEPGTLVLLRDDKCAHVALVRILRRDGHRYYYDDRDGLWHRGRALTEGDIAPRNSFAAQQLLVWSVKGYQVFSDGQSAPLLYRHHDLPATRRQAVLAGVETMLCYYGFDTDNPSDGIPNQYLDAEQVSRLNGWSRVYSVEVRLRVRGRVRVPGYGIANGDYVRAEFWLQHAI